MPGQGKEHVVERGAPHGQIVEAHAHGIEVAHHVGQQPGAAHDGHDDAAALGVDAHLPGAIGPERMDGGLERTTARHGDLQALAAHLGLELV
jgi:hypothetical protein